MAQERTDNPMQGESRPRDPQDQDQVRATAVRPYVAPRLRHLGSVRDLTLGTSNRAGEGGRRNM